MKHANATLAALALGLAALTTPVSADDSLTDRAASALGRYIAAQGNAALTQIREEVTRDLARQIKPYLPQPARAAAARVTADAPQPAPAQ